MRCAIYIMIGPGEAEGRRLCTLMDGLFRHEPGLPLLVLINDTKGELPSLDGLVPKTCEVVTLKKDTPANGPAHCRNILLALRYLIRRGDFDFAMKLDTDALVIAPFVEKVGRFLADHPEVGQVGMAERDTDGKIINFGFYAKYAHRLQSRLQVWRSPKWGVAQAFFGRRAVVRRLMERAVTAGVRDGLHCQGGAYAISKTAVQKIDAEGLLADDPVGIVFSAADDLMLSVLVAAVGLKLASLSAPGEPFGLAAAGLPMPPRQLRDKGYSLIHSVKNDRDFTEDQIVRFFAEGDV